MSDTSVKSSIPSSCSNCEEYKLFTDEVGLTSESSEVICDRATNVPQAMLAGFLLAFGVTLQNLSEAFPDVTEFTPEHSQLLRTQNIATFQEKVNQYINEAGQDVLDYTFKKTIKHLKRELGSHLVLETEQQGCPMANNIGILMSKFLDLKSPIEVFIKFYDFVQGYNVLRKRENFGITVQSETYQKAINES